MTVLTAPPHPSSPPISRPSACLALGGLGLLLLGFGLRLRAAQGPDLGLDGGLAVALAVMPLAEALALLARDVHPPLYYLLLRLWLALAGSTPFGAKYLSLLSGLLTLAVVWAWAGRLAGPRAALAAGTLVAVAPVAVHESVAVRDFVLAALFVTLAAWRHTGSAPRARRGLGLSLALALWTAYTALPLLVALALDGLLHRERRDRLGAAARAGLSLIPWLAFGLTQGFGQTLASGGPRPVVPPEPLTGQLWDALRLLSGGGWLRPEWLGPAALAGALCLLGRPRLAFDQRPREPVFLLLGAGLGLVQAVAINTLWTRQSLSERYVLTALPFLVVLLAGQMARVARWRAAVATALLAAVGLLGTLAWLQRPPPPAFFWDPRTTVQALDQRTEPDDLIVFVSAEQAGYYQVLSRSPRPWVLIPVGTTYLEGDVAGRTAALLTPLLAEERTLWLVLYRQVLGGGTVQIEDWLSLHTFPGPALALSDSDLVPYHSAPDLPPPQTVAARFQGGVVLTQATFPTTVHAGEPLPVALTWQAAGPLPADYTVFVHFLDAGGAIRAQHDAPPLNGRAPTSRWRPGQVLTDRHALLLPADLPSGRYWLAVGLYRGPTRLGLLAGGDTVRLGPVLVERSG